MVDCVGVRSASSDSVFLDLDLRSGLRVRYSYSVDSDESASASESEDWGGRSGEDELVRCNGYFECHLQKEGEYDGLTKETERHYLAHSPTVPPYPLTLPIQGTPTPNFLPLQDTSKGILTPK